MSTASGYHIRQHIMRIKTQQGQVFLSVEWKNVWLKTHLNEYS